MQQDTTEQTADVDEERDWIFAFGHGQRGYSVGTYDRSVPAEEREATGFRLDDRYVVIKGTYSSARARMFEIFGPVWSMQYASAVQAGVDEFGLTELVITADWQSEDGS